MTNPFWIVERVDQKECWILQARLKQHAVWHVEARFPSLVVPLTVKPYVFDIDCGTKAIIKAVRNDETVWYIRCNTRQSGEEAFKRFYPQMSVVFSDCKVDKQGFLS
jgi:hypothetical protein